MSTPWYAPCLRGVMGDWVYYSTLMSAQQIKAQVLKSKDIREAKGLDDYLQRALKERAQKIATYLKKRDTRFFSSIVLGVFGGLPDWVELDFSVVAQTLKVPNLGEIEETLGFLIFDGAERIFAIDGQHRVEGIKRAAEADPERFQNDQYAALLVAHKDDAVGKVRTRRLFCDINKNAVAVSEGDKVIIDEDELAAIVTRRVYAKYPAFEQGNEIAVTEKKEQLSKDGRERFTSLLAIYTVCKRLKKLYKKPRGIPENARENVDAFQAVVSEFLDFVIAHERSLNHYFRLKSAASRNKVLEMERETNHSLFFRPVGLELLSRLYTYFASEQKLNTMRYALEEFQFENPKGIFDGILWKSGRIDASAKAKKAAVELCLYLLHELTSSEESKLVMTLRDVTNRLDYALPPKPPAPPK
jgi:DNA sulfur modification protein DndB